MSKKHKGKKRHPHQPVVHKQHKPLPDNQKTYSAYEYEITTEPIYDDKYMRLPDHVKKTIKKLYRDVYLQPHKTIPDLLKLIEKYPDIPMLSNYLIIAYSNSGQYEQSEAVVLDCYRRCPDYLFARLNYAEICLLRGNYEKVAEIFDHKFELKLLYPERKCFHITEVEGFMGVIGIYFLETGNYNAAETYYSILRKIAPRYFLTKRLCRKLYPDPLKRLWLKMTGILPIK